MENNSFHIQNELTKQPTTVGARSTPNEDSAAALVPFEAFSWLVDGFANERMANKKRGTSTHKRISYSSGRRSVHFP